MQSSWHVFVLPMPLSFKFSQFLRVLEGVVKAVATGSGKSSTKGGVSNLAVSGKLS